MPVIEFDVRRPDIRRWYRNVANTTVVFRLPHKKLVAPILHSLQWYKNIKYKTEWNC